MYYLCMKTAKPSLWTYCISYAAWCFSVTCFYNISLTRAWLTNGNESLICPPPPPFCFLVWLLIFFSFFFYFFYFYFFLFFYDLLELYTTQKKKRCTHIVEVGDADGMVEWPIDLFEWHWPHIYLSIDGRCRTDVVLTQTKHCRWLF